MDTAILPFPQVTNAEFLKHVLGPIANGENAWCCTFAINPQQAEEHDWGGFRVSQLTSVHDYKVNAYFSVAVLAGRRRRVDFLRMSCVVLDDAPQDEGASWVLETSPGNYQIGYIIRPAITDEGIAKRLQEALSRQGLVKADRSGYSSVRYVRLPNGYNTKVSPAYQHVLQEWQPECIFTLEDLIEKFDLDANFIYRRDTQSQGNNVYEHSVRQSERRFQGDDHEYVRNIVTGDMYHDSLLALSARYIARGIAPIAVAETLQGMMLARTERDARWQSRFEEIPRLVRGAAEKFTPIPDPIQAGPLLQPYVDAPITPMPTLIRGFLPLDGVGMLWAPPGGFKSFLALDWALSIATGREWLGHKVIKGSVWYLAGEGQQGMRMRIAAWRKAKNYTAPIENLLLSERALILDSEDNIQSPALRGLLDMIEDGNIPSIIIVDTLSRSMSGDENATKDAARFVAGLDSIIGAARRHDKSICVLLVHHSRKDGEVYRGSSVLRGAMDFEFELERESNTFNAKLTSHKVKDGERPEPVDLRAEIELLGEAKDNHGITISMSSLALWMYTPPTASNPLETKASKLLPDVMNILRQYPDGLSTVSLKSILRASEAKVKDQELPGILESMALAGRIAKRAGPRGANIWSCIA